MLPEQRARLRRLFLLLLLALSVAVSYSAVVDEPEPMARAWEVLQKRVWAIENHTESPNKAQLCCDNSGIPLRGAKAPLILPTRSSLILTFPQCPTNNPPEVTVTLAGTLPLRALWKPHQDVPTLEIMLPDTIQAAELKVVGAGKIMWRRYAYVTHALPLAPQVPAWRGVLEDACRWAKGARTQEEITAALAHGLFASGRIVYPTQDRAKAPTYVHHNIFALHEFLTHQGPSSGNCVDTSDYLVLCAAALGVPLQLVQISDTQERDLVTNPLCPIGWDPSDPASYQTLTMEMHQVAYLKSNNHIYDACFFLPSQAHPGGTKIPTFSWDVDDLPTYWQGKERGTGLIRTPEGSEPQARLSTHLPMLE